MTGGKVFTMMLAHGGNQQCWWNSTLHCAEMCSLSMSCRIPDPCSLNSTWPGWKTAWSVCYKPNSLPSLIHKKSFSSKSISKHFWHHVLSLGYAILTVRITEAFGLPKPSLFCNVQRDVASLPSYSKLNSKCDS